MAGKKKVKKKLPKIKPLPKDELRLIRELKPEEQVEVLFNGMLTRDQPAVIESRFNLKKGTYYLLIKKFQKSGHKAMLKQDYRGRHKDGTVPFRVEKAIKLGIDRIMLVQQNALTSISALKVLREEIINEFKKEENKNVESN